MPRSNLSMGTGTYTQHTTWHRSDCRRTGPWPTPVSAHAGPPLRGGRRHRAWAVPPGGPCPPAGCQRRLEDWRARSPRKGSGRRPLRGIKGAHHRRSALARGWGWASAARTQVGRAGSRTCTKATLAASSPRPSNRTAGSTRCHSIAVRHHLGAYVRHRTHFPAWLIDEAPN